MGYDQWWKTLETLITEFRKKQISIPPETMTTLRSAKTMIKVYNADLTRIENIPTIENYLLNIESTLINTAKEKISPTYAEKWLQKLEKARKQEEPRAQNQTLRFIPGLPKGEHWIRVLPSEDILKENIKKLAAELELSTKIQQDGYILIHGEKEKVREFVKRMAEECRKTRKT